MFNIFTFGVCQANSDVTSSQMPTIVLQAKNSESIKTATGLSLSVKETPQSVSLISAEQLKQNGITSLADALKQTTGINVIRDSGRYRFQSRGFYIDQTEEDGLSSAVAGAASNPYRSATSATALDIYDHIEVLRGATGLTQANGEPGGTINAVRKHPTEEFQMQGYLQGGSWNRLRSMLDVSGALNESKSVRGRMVTAVGRSDSFKNNVSGDDGLLYGVIDFDLTPSTLFRLGAMYQKTHTTPDYFGLPMATNGQDTELPDSTYLGADWSTQQFEKYNAFAELEHQFNERWKISAKLNANKNESLEKFAGLAQLSTSYTGISASSASLKTNNKQYYDNDSTELSSLIRLNGQYELFGATHDVFATLQYSSTHEYSRWKRSLNSTAYNVWTFTPDLISQPNWNSLSDVYNDIENKNQTEQTAASLGTRFNILDKTHLLLGGRYTHFKAKGSTQYITWANQPDNEYSSQTPVSKDKFIPYVGLTYDITPTMSAYISHTEIFKPQTNLDVSKKVLPPVTGKNDEFGFKSTWFDQRLNTSIAFFQIEQQNRPIYDSGTSSYMADGNVRSRGIDVELSGYVNDRLRLFTGYTYNKSKYLSTESTNSLQGTNFSKHTPNQMFRLFSEYQFSGMLDQWSAGIGINAQTDTSSLYNIKQGGYTLWNANLRYQFSPELSVNLIGQNLTDKRYYENQRTRMLGGNNFLGDPRNFLVRFDWKY